MSSETIRVFIVDDHPMLRKGLAAMIDAEPDLEHVGEAGDGNEALRLAPATRPDVVLMDLVMPQMDGIAATEQLRSRLPTVQIVILTNLLNPAEVQRAVQAGASGYLLKSAGARELAATIRSVHCGQKVLAPAAADVLATAARQQPPGADLTAREREILALMTRGMNNQQIAAELSIAVPTVKFHVTNVLSKLQVENRTEAVLAALKNKLVPPA